MRRWTVIAAAASLSLAGCSTTSRPVASPVTSPTTASPAPTSTTSPASPNAVNPDVIPPVITIPYVDAVFKVLEHIDGNVSRNLLLTGRVTQQDLTDLRAIYGDPLYAQEVKIAQQSIGGDLSNVRRPPGDVLIKVLKIIHASKSCIFVSTQSNYSLVLINPGPPTASEYWMLTPKLEINDPITINPTDWSLSFNADFTAPTIVPDQCIVNR